MEMDFFKFYFLGDWRYSQYYIKIKIMLYYRKKNIIKNSVLDYIRNKQLNWYGHVRIMNEEWLPRKTLEWCPPRKKEERETLKFVDAGVYSRNERERGIDDLEWVNKEGWREKIKVQAQKDVKSVHK